jgi:hypothetical protein
MLRQKSRLKRQSSAKQQEAEISSSDAFSCLPRELLDLILSQLDAKSTARVSCSCKRLHKFVGILLASSCVMIPFQITSGSEKLCTRTWNSMISDAFKKRHPIATLIQVLFSESKSYFLGGIGNCERQQVELVVVFGMPLYHQSF